MSQVILIGGTSPSLGITQGANVYIVGTQSRLGQASTEIINQRTVRLQGRFTNQWLRVVTNGVSATSTWRSRVNGANGGQSFTVATATTGEFEDTTGFDDVIPTDEFNGQAVVGAGGTTFNPISVSYMFTPSFNDTYCLHTTGLMNLNSPADNTSYFKKLVGNTANTVETTETNAQVKMKSAGQFKNFFVSIGTNGQAATTVFRSRKNAGNGNLVMSVAALTTGVFEDVINLDSYVVNDLINFSVTTGVGGGTGLFTSTGGASTQTTDGSMPLVSGAALTINAATTSFLIPAGAPTALAAEATARTEINYSPVASKLECYIQTNTVTATSTFRLRVNGADVNQTVSIAASTTGWFEDGANTDNIAANDEINYSLVTGATGTSMVFQTAVMNLTVAPNADQNPYQPWMQSAPVLAQ